MTRYIPLFLLVLLSACQYHRHTSSPRVTTATNDVTGLVNVFLGSSGDHGQLSPAASYPFSMMSIGPQTYPTTHMGYEFKARTFLGFTHTRLEGVGCQGSGGNILVKPYTGTDDKACTLTKVSEQASPGYYSVTFSNGIAAAFAVAGKAGVHRYTFPVGEKGISVDLSHAFVRRFVAEAHTLDKNSVSGWIDTKTTCGAGTSRLYYYLQADASVTWAPRGDHALVAVLPSASTALELRVAFSSVSTAHARKNLATGTFDAVRSEARQAWNTALTRFQVKGDQERVQLFYSLLYRALQSPYNISEPDGQYTTISGETRQADHAVYNGWAIWDNYRTQLPLLSLGYPEQYKDIVWSIANLYPYGKKNWSTQHEPSPTVRTEHAVVVLLDASRKGYAIQYNAIMDSLVSESNRLDYSAPDKALESSYDAWALSEIFRSQGDTAAADRYKAKALEYKQYWDKDFRDIRANDVDRMQTRGLYQGTIWQYRWFVPFDVNGLIGRIGGDAEYVKQLDEFFVNDYYNHANQPDLQVPMMYNMSTQPLKSQALIHHLAVDTVVQHYLNDNSRGIGSFIDRIYKNEPQAYIRTMDDDAGTMSSWYVWASSGLFPACVGWPVYYLHVPLMQEATLRWSDGKQFHIEVENYGAKNMYIKGVVLNGKPLSRTWLTHQEITAGGTLKIIASAVPDKQFGVAERWVTDIAR